MKRLFKRYSWLFSKKKTRPPITEKELQRRTPQSDQFFETSHVSRKGVTFKVEGNFSELEKSRMIHGIEDIYSKYLVPTSPQFIGMPF